MYFGMGISNTKLNGLWIDYFIMGCIQAHLLYFGCLLFSVDLKFKKGALLEEKLKRYCKIVYYNSSEETLKKVDRKLKH